MHVKAARLHLDFCCEPYSLPELLYQYFPGSLHLVHILYLIRHILHADSLQNQPRNRSALGMLGSMPGPRVR